MSHLERGVGLHREHDFVKLLAHGRAARVDVPEGGAAFLFWELGGLDGADVGAGDHPVNRGCEPRHDVARALIRPALGARQAVLACAWAWAWACAHVSCFMWHVAWAWAWAWAHGHGHGRMGAWAWACAHGHGRPRGRPCLQSSRRRSRQGRRRRRHRCTCTPPRALDRGAVQGRHA